MTKKIGFLVYDGFQMLDLSGPMCAFEMAERSSPSSPYRMQVISVQGGSVRNTLGMAIDTVPLRRLSLDTLIVVGGERWSLGQHEVVAIQHVAARVRRLASVCTGAFVLAQCKLLDGRRATTHWRFAGELQRDYPAVRVESNPIYITDGNVWTSAGITAGIDLALALIEDDCGTSVAREVSQELVVYYRRPGGQSQFSAMLELAPESDRIRLVLSYAREHLKEPLSVERLARIACLSVRQFGRAFKAETGETPAKAIERLRTEVALNRIENDAEPAERVATSVGFSDPERMRRAFIRLYGEPPQAIRRKSRG